MIKDLKRNVVYIIKDNEGTIHGASLVKSKATKAKEKAQYNLEMSGSRKIASIYVEKLL